MTLIILTVVVIVSLITVLAVYLYVIGVLLNRIADLDDCLGNVKTIMRQAEVILSGVGRINQTGGVVAEALPLLVEAAEGATDKLVPPQEVPRDSVPRAVSAGVGYLDV